MRIALIVVSINIVVCVALGVAAWRSTAPARFAGVERDAARLGSDGELPEAERPGTTRREIVELLHAREFDVLTRIIETRNQRALADPKEEWELGRVLDAFEIRDDSLADEFEDWRQASPRSFAPLLAAAQHRFVRAFLERGTRSAAETTPEQFRSMEQQLALLSDDIDAALQREPKLSEAYAILIDAARARSRQIDCGKAAKLGLEVMPASHRIRTALAICRLPRWGGSYPRVEQVASAAEPFMADNPELAALHGIVEWDRGRSSRGTEAMQHLDAALDAGAYWLFYVDRAAAHLSAKRFQQSLDDIDAALELAPESPDLLVDRMYALLGLGRNDEIPDIIALVDAIDPMNTKLPGLKEYAVELAAYESDQPRREPLGGGDSQAYYLRGRAHLQSKDHDSALAAFETAVRLDPQNFEAYRNIDYILALRGDWDRVISMWDEYIARNPQDGKAIFERAGSYRHSGDEARAMEDVKKACDLGVQPACAVLKR